MKKLIIALTAVAAFTGSASAADLAARPYTKAPMMEPAYSWTGFYIFGGGGYGMFDSNTYATTFPGGTPLTIGQKVGGDGYFGTVGAGYDWQFNGSWVAGIFADGQFGSLRGTLQDPDNFITGRIKMQDAWAAGARLGYLVAPNVYSYVNAGYSGSHWSGTTMPSGFPGVPAAIPSASYTLKGWFVGGGVENTLNISGNAPPGWFMMT